MQMRHYFYIAYTIILATIAAAVGCMDMPKAQNMSIEAEIVFSEDKVPSHEEDNLHEVYDTNTSLFASCNTNSFSAQRSTSSRQLSRRNSIIKTSNSTAIKEGKNFDYHIVFAYIYCKGLLPLASKNSSILLLKLRKLLI